LPVSAVVSVYCVVVALAIQAQLVVVLVSQRSHWRPSAVPVGPVQDPFETVSLEPTTAGPEIDPADVTSTAAAARAGAARPKASNKPYRAMEILLRPYNSPPPCGSVLVATS
jgi:hypothetical protein